MDKNKFDDLVGGIAIHISPGERLVVTLQYLAISGNPNPNPNTSKMVNNARIKMSGKEQYYITAVTMNFVEIDKHWQ